jgi:hypothetical protein
MTGTLIIVIFVIVIIVVFLLFFRKKDKLDKTEDPNNERAGNARGNEPICKFHLNMNTSSYDKEAKDFSVAISEVDDCMTSSVGWTKENICKNYEQMCGGRLKTGVLNVEGTKCVINDCEPCDPVFELDSDNNFVEVSNVYSNLTKSCPLQGVSRAEACGKTFEDCNGNSRAAFLASDGLGCTVDCDVCPDAYELDGDDRPSIVVGGQCLIEAGEQLYFQTKEDACRSKIDNYCYVNGQIQTRTGSYIEDENICSLVCNKCPIVGDKTCFEYEIETGDYTSKTYVIDNMLDEGCSRVATDGAFLDTTNCKTAREVFSGENDVELCPAIQSLNLASEDYNIQSKSYTVNLDSRYDLRSSTNGSVFSCPDNGTNPWEVCASYKKDCFDEEGNAVEKSGTWDHTNGGGSCVIENCYKEYSQECEIGQDTYTTECTATCGANGRQDVISCFDDSLEISQNCNEHECPDGCTGAASYADIDSEASSCSKYCGGNGIIVRKDCTSVGEDITTPCGQFDCPVGCEGGDREYSEWSEPPTETYGAYNVSRTHCGTGETQSEWRFLPGWRPIQLRMLSDHQFIVRIHFPAVLERGLYATIANIRQLEQNKIEELLSKSLNISFQFSVPTEGSVGWETPFYSYAATMREFSDMGSGVQFDADKNDAAFFEISSKDLPNFNFTRNVHDNFTYRITARVEGRTTYSNEFVLYMNQLNQIACEGAWSTCTNGLKTFTQTTERFPGEYNRWSYINGTQPQFSFGGACGHRTNAMSSTGCNTWMQADNPQSDIRSNTPYALKMVNFGSVFEMAYQYSTNVNYFQNLFRTNVNADTPLTSLLQSNLFLSATESGLNFKTALNEVSSSISFIPVVGEAGFYYMYIRELEMYMRLETTVHDKSKWGGKVQYLTKHTGIVDAYKDLYKFNLMKRTYINQGILSTCYVIGTKTYPPLMVSFMIDKENSFLAAVQDTTFALYVAFFLMSGTNSEFGPVEPVELAKCLTTTWTAYEECRFPNGATCGDGKKTRTRQILQGTDCSDSLEEEADCNRPCPQDCVIHRMSTGCSKSCDGGVNRVQDYIHTPASNGGLACPTLGYTDEACNENIACCDPASGVAVGGCSIPCSLENETGVQEYKCTNTDGTSFETGTGNCQSLQTCDSVGVYDMPEVANVFDTEFDLRFREINSGRFLTLVGGELFLYRKFENNIKNQAWAMVDYDIETQQFSLMSSTGNQTTERWTYENNFISTTRLTSLCSLQFHYL